MNVVFRFTKAELDDAAEFWRWCCWIRFWGDLGCLMAAVHQMEMSLWR